MHGPTGLPCHPHCHLTPRRSRVLTVTRIVVVIQDSTGRLYQPHGTSCTAPKPTLPGGGDLPWGPMGGGKSGTHLWALSFHRTAMMDFAWPVWFLVDLIFSVLHHLLPFQPRFLKAAPPRSPKTPTAHMVTSPIPGSLSGFHMILPSWTHSSQNSPTLRASFQITPGF